MPVLLCPHCGTSNRVGSNFCNACGTDLRGGEDAPPARTGRTEPTFVPSQPGDSPDWDADPASDTLQDDPAHEPGEQPWLDYGFDDAGGTRLPGSSLGDEASEHAASEHGATEYGREESGGPGTGLPDNALQDEDWSAEEWPDGDDFEDDDPDGTRGPRLITGVQGLLDPIRVSRQLGEAQPSALGEPARLEEPSRGDGSALDALRRFRELLYAEPRLAGNRRRRAPIGTRAVLYIPWLFVAVAVLIGVPIVLGLGGSENLPPEWPGVVEAHTLIETLPPDAVVLIYWAYDPATAGELDLAARPVVRHLLERRARLVGVSPLPAGPATARRVVEEIRQSRTQVGVFSQAGRNPWPVLVEFLPGGAGALPLMATNLDAALGPDANDPARRDLTQRAPTLALVLAAQAEDAQHWLEQVHARNGVPVVAVVSAGADPILRPYLDSGQLRGLVSGFDGAFHYQARLDPQESRSDGLLIRQHAAAQNWAHLAAIVALLLGNLAAIVGRSAGRE